MRGTGVHFNTGALVAFSNFQIQKQLRFTVCFDYYLTLQAAYTHLGLQHTTGLLITAVTEGFGFGGVVRPLQVGSGQLTQQTSQECVLHLA